MRNWYEIYPLPPRRTWRSTAPRVALIVGAFAAGSGLVNLAYLGQGWQEERAVLGSLLAVGGLLIIWYVLRLMSPPKFVYRGTFLRLDDRGVWIRTGSADSRTAASVEWTAVEAVEVRSTTFGPDITEAGSEVRDVLQFVLTDEDAVEHDPFPPFVMVEAVAQGLSPVAAALSFVAGRTSDSVITQMLGWLTENRPDLPVRDLRT
jgi:hypothetical protein